jgi:predicted tellurium resistance membrane protein TerC
MAMGCILGYLVVLIIIAVKVESHKYNSNSIVVRSLYSNTQCTFSILTHGQSIIWITQQESHLLLFEI